MMAEDAAVEPSGEDDAPANPDRVAFSEIPPTQVPLRTVFIGGTLAWIVVLIVSVLLWAFDVKIPDAFDHIIAISATGVGVGAAACLWLKQSRQPGSQ